MRQKQFSWIVIASLIVYFASSSFVFAQEKEPLSLMEEGNRLYEVADYKGAIEQYEQIVGEGVESAAVYYNLGNSYFKLGDIGQAILNYERATRLTPRDADLQVNLRLARETAVDQYESGGSWLENLVGVSRRWLTVDEAAGLSLGLWFLAVGFGVVYWFKRSEWAQYGMVVSGILLVGGLISWGGMSYLDYIRPEAIITVRTVDVISAPGVGGIKEFSLHSGAKVAILEQRGDWVRLSLPSDQLQGWVEADAISLIEPVIKE